MLATTELKEKNVCKSNQGIPERLPKSQDDNAKKEMYVSYYIY